MQEIKRALYSYYKEEGDPFVLVAIPEQNITDRILQVKIYHAKLGEFAIEGVGEKKKNQLAKYLHFHPGESVNPISFESDIHFINRNPFRRANMIYSMGRERGTTDLVISVTEKPFYRIYSGFDNTGVKTIGQNRFFSGCVFNHVFGLDHLFSFHCTATPVLKKFQAFTGQYTAFLPCKHIFELYGGYSKLHVKLPFPATHNSGESIQASFRYTVPLPATAKIHHEISFGADYKNTNNETAFSLHFPNIGNFVNLTQILLSYFGLYETASMKIETSLELFCSPGAWLPNQTPSDFSSLRPGAANHWLYNIGEVKYVQRLPSLWSLHLRVRAQTATQPLLPSEQFGLGGYDTVRGYDERQINTDMASFASLEFWTPSFPMISAMRIKTIRDSLQFLAFLDFGRGRNRSLSEAEENQFLIGIGPGARYTLDPHIQARCDLGVKLHRKDLFTNSPFFIHFSAIASF